MFVVALLSSALTTRLKDHARQSAKLAYRTKVLFDTNQLLQKAETDASILNTLISQIQKLLGKHIIIYPVQHGTLGTPILSPDSASAEKSEFLTRPREQEAALWVLAHNKRAGAYTDTFPDALCHYLAIRVQVLSMEWPAWKPESIPWIPLNTAFWFPCWRGQPWPWKTARISGKKSRQLF